MRNRIFIVLCHRNKSTDGHVAPFGHIILILKQAVVANTSISWVLSVSIP